MTTRRYSLIVVLALITASPCIADFQVNTFTTGDQQYPDVATDAAGNFVIVWQSDGQDGFGQGIFGRPFSAGGTPGDVELLVNQATIGDQRAPAVAYANDGSFYVVFENFDGSSFGIAKRHFDGDGTILSDQSFVNSTTTGAQTAAAISGGSAVLAAWESDGQDGSGLGIFTTTIDLASGESQMNVSTLGDQSRPGVGCVYLSISPPVTAAAVAWESGADIKLRGIGSLFSSELSVNTYTTSLQANPSLACSAPLGGNLLVVWDSLDQDGDGLGIFGRLYDASMSPLGSEFQINQYTTSNQRYPDVAADGNGNFIVVWQSNGQDGSGDGIYGRRFDSAGTPLGNDFRVNQQTANGQLGPAVAANADGSFVVTWTSVLADGDGRGVFARRLTPIDAGDTASAASIYVTTSVTSPNAGLVSIEDGNPAEFNAGLAFASVSIDAPPATPANPLTLVFNFHYALALLLAPVAEDIPDFFEQFTTVYRNGIEVPDCTGLFGTADPDPCVQSRQLVGQELFITVLTSAASQWDFTIGRCPAQVDNACVPGFAKSSLLVRQGGPATQKLVAKLLQGPALAQTDLGNPLSLAEGGTNTIVALCVYNGADALAGELYVPRAGDDCDGHNCWSAVGRAPNDVNGPGKGYKYKDAVAATDGVKRIIYLGGGAGQSKAIVKAAGLTMPSGIAAALAGSSHATVQLRAVDGECLSAEMATVIANDPERFKAK